MARTFFGKETPPLNAPNPFARSDTATQELLLVWPTLNSLAEPYQAEIQRLILPIEDTLVLGRRSDIPFPIDDERVSRKHAEITCQPDGTAILTDCSRNGTYICPNHEWQRLRRAEPVPLKPGALFACASQIWQYRHRSTADSMEKIAIPNSYWVERIQLEPEVWCEHTPLGAKGTLVGGAALAELKERIEKLANNNNSVLIFGETGTGKEVVANALHSLGSRKNKIFIPVNCGAIPASLMESELFGRVKGAYTDAQPHAGY